MDERPRRRWIIPPDELAWTYVTDEEEIYFDRSPDLAAWIWTQWAEIMAMVLLVFIMLISGDSRVVWTGLVFELAIFAVVLVRMIGQIYTRYVLTDHRALRVSGVLRRDYEWISWRKVTDVSVRRSVFDRWFGTATIQIQSANEMSNFKEMTDVPEPIAFAEMIAEMVQR